MPIILFICEGNIFRSQMAEGFFNASAPPGWRAESAGTNPGRQVHPEAIALMAEAGIDISGQRPKRLDPAVAAKARRIIAMCELGSCSVAVTERAERWAITDPAALPPDRRREIRNDIGRRVHALLEEIQTPDPTR